MNKITCKNCNNLFLAGNANQKYCCVSCLINKNTKPVGECIEWIGGKNEKGYGKTRWLGKSYFVHRLVLPQICSPINNNNLVLHSCNNTSCCNVKHLRWGSYKDNSDDKFNSGREIKGENHKNAILTEDDIKDIRLSYQRGFTQDNLAKMFKTSRTNISLIVNNKRWKHVG